MMNVADRKHATAPGGRQSWLEGFAAALQSQDAGAAADTVSAGRPVARRAGLHLDHRDRGRPRGHRGDAAADARAHQPGEFHIPPQRTPPRWVSRAGTECIEAIFEFETAFGPGNGVLRLVPDADRRACAPGR